MFRVFMLVIIVLFVLIAMGIPLPLPQILIDFFVRIIDAVKNSALSQAIADIWK